MSNCCSTRGLHGFHAGKLSLGSFNYETRFLWDSEFHLKNHLRDENWFCSLAYLVGILSILDELNKSLQGVNTILFFVQDKIKGLIKKLELSMRGYLHEWMLIVSSSWKIYVRKMKFIASIWYISLGVISQRILAQNFV